MERVIEPELLDVLPPADRRAEHSRADLRRVNFLMGHARLLARLWHQSAVPASACSLAELGAGDGTFCLRVMNRLIRQWPIRTVTLVDRQRIVSEATLAEFQRLHCAVEIVSQDVFDWLRSGPKVTVLMANLFLHHFTEAELRKMLALAAARADYFIACEPRRGLLGLAGSRMLGLLGCNEVTRHDAIISVRAGFARKEISALWPGQGWEVDERELGLFSHGFAARRRTRN